MWFWIQGESSGSLPSSDAAGPNQGFDTVLDNSLTATQQVGEIPANATGPAYLTIQAEDTRVWIVALGKASTDVITDADAPIKLDPVNGPIGIVIDSPRKGFVLARAICACDDGILRASAAWNL